MYSNNNLSEDEALARRLQSEGIQSFGVNIQFNLTCLSVEFQNQSNPRNRDAVNMQALHDEDYAR